jgi:hypothetical protein
MSAQVCPFRCCNGLVSVERTDAAGNVLEYHCAVCDEYFVPGVTSEDIDPRDDETMTDYVARVQAVLRGELATAA